MTSWVAAGRAAREGADQAHRLLKARTEDGQGRDDGRARGRLPIQQRMNALPALDCRRTQPAIAAHALKSPGQNELGFNDAIRVNDDILARENTPASFRETATMNRQVSMEACGGFTTALQSGGASVNSTSL